MVSVEEAKLHCRVNYTDEDASFTTYIGAASEWMAKIGVNVEVDPLPNPIKQACLLMVAHFYDNREAVPELRRTTPLPLGVDTLIAPYREHTL